MAQAHYLSAACCQMDTFLILEALGVCWGLQLPTAAPRATS
jgi:hypothetical protein